MKCRIILFFDDTDPIPLKLELPMGMNPALATVLLSQAITGLASSQISRDQTKLIVPVATLPKVAD